MIKNTARVVGSIPTKSTKQNCQPSKWTCSSVGRAVHWNYRKRRAKALLFFIKVKETMESDPRYFWKKYESIGTTNNWTPNPDKSSVCRYCGKNNLEVTFKEKTHLLPELLGQNGCLTYDECDQCNKLFSKYESHLSKFLRPYLTLMAVKGKKKIPVFQSRTLDRSENTRTVMQIGSSNKRELLIQDDDDYYIDETTNTLCIHFRKEQYRPNYIYKSLLKIGLGLLPKEFDDFNQKSFEWLTNRSNEISYFPITYFTTLKRTYFNNPVAELYRTKKIFSHEEEFPEYILILKFANQVIQLFLPFSDESLRINNGQRNLIFTLFPAYFFDRLKPPGKIEIKQYNLGVDEMVSENQNVHFSFQEVNYNIQSK